MTSSAAFGFLEDSFNPKTMMARFRRSVPCIVAGEYLEKCSLFGSSIFNTVVHPSLLTGDISWLLYLVVYFDSSFRNGCFHRTGGA